MSSMVGAGIEQCVRLRDRYERALQDLDRDWRDMFANDTERTSTDDAAAAPSSDEQAAAPLRLVVAS